MKYKEIEIDEEKIYLKKNRYLGWSVVHPVRIDNKLNWKNLIAGGSWIKLFILVIFMLIILGCVYEYSTAVSMANKCLNSTNYLWVS